jgi:lipopolysaccharide transport system permease protein
MLALWVLGRPQRSGASMAANFIAFADFLLTFSILIGMMAWYQFARGWQTAVLAAFIFIASIGPALWVTALKLKYRDPAVSSPHIVQLGMSRRSGVALTSGRRSGASSILSTRWWGSSMTVDGESSASRASYLPRLAASHGGAALFLRLGVRRFPMTEASFADLI